PQDLVGVMAWNRATAFTTDRNAIAGVLERFKEAHERIESKLALRFSGLAAIYGGSRIPPGIQGDIDRVFDGPAGPARALVTGAVPRAHQIDDDNRRRIEELRTPTADPRKPLAST